MEEVVVKKQITPLLAGALIATPLLFPSAGAFALSPIEELGKFVFFDKISKPEDTQACASCHDAKKGWTLPLSTVNATTVVAPGAKPKRVGSIKVPANAYAFFSPQFKANDGGFPVPYSGGNFWDGRAEGWGAPGAPNQKQGTGTVSETITWDDLGLDTLITDNAQKKLYKSYLGPTADQALNPFPNDVEQNIRQQRVCKTVKDATYSFLFTQAFNEEIKCNANTYAKNFKRIALSLAAYQASTEVNQFSSKRDQALLADRDGQFPLDDFNKKQNRGHALFYGLPAAFFPGGPPPGVTIGAGCFLCHNGVPEGDVPTNPADGTERRQLYTDNRFHNINLPFNREIPGVAWRAKTGLQAHVRDDATAGFFRTPTLRNVSKGANANFVKAYFHNGWCKSLECVVHFYNTRDVLPDCAAAPTNIQDATAAEAAAHNCWPKSEFPKDTLVQGLVGNIGLSAEDEADLVAYLKTLEDTIAVSQPKIK